MTGAHLSPPAGDEEATAEVEASLLEAFTHYERALMTDDVPELDALFAAATTTIRSDGGASLVGHEAIAEFRAGRGRPPLRSLERVHVRPVGHDAAVIVAETRRTAGTGVQTQLWQRAAGQWQVTVAHVSVAPEPGVGPVSPDEVATIWRVRDVRPTDVAAPAAAPQRTGAGPALAGARLAVKDLFAVAGQRVGAGNPRWLAEAPVETTTAGAVRRLLEAGCVLTGIAQTDELAFSLGGTNTHYGTPPNPAAPDRIPGGSTSGPASAVAAHLADVALGTDTAGSVRVPASYCGLYGLRTTHDAVVRDGLVPLAPSFDTVGVLTRTAAELAAAADVLLPPETTEGEVVELVLLPELLERCTTAVRHATVAAARALSLRSRTPLVHRRGAVDDATTWLSAFRTVQQVEAWRTHGEFVTRTGSLAPDVADRFRAGAEVDARAEEQAREILAAARARLLDLLGDGRALVLPATAGPAPLRGADEASVAATRAGTLQLTCLASLGGLPALSVPLARVGALPLGLSLVGRPGADRALMRLVLKEELR